MSTQDIVQKLWSLCDVLRDDGITYHRCVNELALLVFLKPAANSSPKTPPTNPLLLERIRAERATVALFRRTRTKASQLDRAAAAFRALATEHQQ